MIQIFTTRIVNTAEIVISDIDVNKDSIGIKGGISGSGLAFISCKYIIRNSDIYLNFKYALVTKRNRKGSFNLLFSDDFKNIKNIYIQGKNENDSKLIWSR